MHEKNPPTNAGTSGIIKGSQSAFFSSLNTDQHSQLMNLLQTHLPSDQNEGHKTSEVTHVAGISSTNGSHFHDKNCVYWVINSGASSHICYNKSLFLTMRRISNVSVILPTQYVVLNILVM